MRVGIVIPALDEAGTIAGVVQACRAQRPAGDEFRVVVCDNGCSDDTAQRAAGAGAEVVAEPCRGYGAACLRALAHLDDWAEALAFVDGDGSSDLRDLPALLSPLRHDQADLVLGCRSAARPGALTWPQRFGNALTCTLLRLRFGAGQRDLGPFRAIRRAALQELRISDRTWGWTVEMQIKAMRHGLRVAEVPVRWHPRQAGQSKISGRLSGVLRAGGKILWTFARQACRRRSRPRPVLDEVVYFVKHPRPGAVKTRLAAAIGEAPACRVYERLAHHGHHELMKLHAAGLARLTVYTAGAAPETFRTWLPGAGRYEAQPDGDLGVRLDRALARAFERGARRVAVVGSDCPTLRATTVSAALGALGQADLAAVPATDGGYALLAARRHVPELFRDMPWSTGEVMARTRQRAADLGLTLRELPAETDIDRAEDLAALRPLLAVVMPALEEADRLRSHLPALLQQAAAAIEGVEVVVVDGGSSDDSAGVAERLGARVLRAPRGRATQMNAGAAAARGDWLWFLHADCIPADGAVQALIETLRRHPDREWGYLPARLGGRGLRYRIAERLINLRSRWWRLPYGDQGLVVRRELFELCGGYDELPLLEDLLLVRTLGHHGRPLRVPSPITIDVRRWRRDGFWLTTWRNGRLLFEHLVLGRSCAELARRCAASWPAGSTTEAAAHPAEPEALQVERARGNGLQ